MEERCIACGDIIQEGRMVCPICSGEYGERPAISRRNGQEICPDCGTKEALDSARYFIAKDMNDEEWEDYKSEIIDVMRKKVVV